MDDKASVVQPWVSALSWKQQSILFSSLRGPDHALMPNIKQVSKWMRAVSQHNADPSKPYMNGIVLPEAQALEKELEHSPCHFVHHFADGLAVIACGHPDQDVCILAAHYHHYIAEELFHFRPEDPEVFRLRHRDKRDGVDAQEQTWSSLWNGMREDYLSKVATRFAPEPHDSRIARQKTVWLTKPDGETLVVSGMKAVIVWFRKPTWSKAVGQWTCDGPYQCLSACYFEGTKFYDEAWEQVVKSQGTKEEEWAEKQPKIAPEAWCEQVVIEVV